MLSVSKVPVSVEHRNTRTMHATVGSKPGSKPAVRKMAMGSYFLPFLLVLLLLGFVRGDREIRSDKEMHGWELPLLPSFITHVSLSMCVRVYTICSLSIQHH